MNKQRDSVLVEVLNMLSDNILRYGLLKEALDNAGYTEHFNEMHEDIDRQITACRIFIKWITDMREAK